MAWLPKSRAQRMLRDVYAQAGKTASARRYAFDILVVDEAHHVRRRARRQWAAAGVTRWTASARSQFESSQKHASTDCSSAPPHITATWSRSRRCWR